MDEVRELSSLQGIETALRKELEHIAEGYIVVGYLLKKTRDTELYKEKGYGDVYDFAKQTFNISRTWAARFMQINDTYSIDGNSPEIQERYKGYGSSKLSEMLTLPENIREEVPVTATVKEIRDAKEIVRDTEGRYSPQMSLCDVAQNQGEPIRPGEWGKQLAIEFFKEEGKPCFEKMWKLCKETDPKGQEIMAIVAPTKFKMFRMQRANALFGENKIQIMPYNGQGGKENVDYIQFLDAFWETFEAGNAAEAYEKVYGEPIKEKKEREVIKAEKLKKEPGKPQEEKAEETNETENKDISNPATAGVSGEMKEPETETSTEETAETLNAENNKEDTNNELPDSTKHSGESESESHPGNVNDMAEEQIPGQMEITKDMPQCCPEGQQETKIQEEHSREETEGKQAMNSPEEPERPYGSRKQYLESLSTYGMALYMAAAMQTLPHMRLNFADFWEKWLKAEVDDNGEEIEVVE